jgi:hypothetical protein
MSHCTFGNFALAVRIGRICWGRTSPVYLTVTPEIAGNGGLDPNNESRKASSLVDWIST